MFYGTTSVPTGSHHRHHLNPMWTSKCNLRVYIFINTFIWWSYKNCISKFFLQPPTVKLKLRTLLQRIYFFSLIKNCPSNGYFAGFTMADDKILMTSELFRFHIRATQSWTWKHMMCISSILINVCIGPSMIKDGSDFHAKTQSTMKEDHTVYTLVMWSHSLFSFSKHRNCSSNGGFCLRAISQFSVISLELGDRFADTL